MRNYVGLDISMKEPSICIISQEGQVVLRDQVKSDPEVIGKRLDDSGFSIEKLGLESGYLCQWLVNGLTALNHPAICVDVRHMATVRSVQINKSDDNDEKKITEAIRCNLYRLITQKPLKALEISTLLGARRTLVKQGVQVFNTIRGPLKNFGIRV